MDPQWRALDGGCGDDRLRRSRRLRTGGRRAGALGHGARQRQPAADPEHAGGDGRPRRPGDRVRDDRSAGPVPDLPLDVSFGGEGRHGSSSRAAHGFPSARGRGRALGRRRPVRRLHRPLPHRPRGVPGRRAKLPEARRPRRLARSPAAGADGPLRHRARAVPEQRHDDATAVRPARRDAGRAASSVSRCEPRSRAPPPSRSPRRAAPRRSTGRDSCATPAARTPTSVPTPRR